MKKDGSERSCILWEKDVRSLIIVDGFVFYLNSRGQLLKMNPDGSVMTLDEREDYESLQFDEGYLLYYRPGYSDTGPLSRISRIYLGNEPTEPEDADVDFFMHLIDDGWIYYENNKNVERIRFDETEKQLILSLQSEWAFNGIVIADGYLYTVEFVVNHHNEHDYDEHNYYLWKIDIDELNAGIPPEKRQDIKLCLEDNLDTYISGAAGGYLYTVEFSGGDLFWLHCIRYDNGELIYVW
jgi:hypothetical protein